MSEWKETDIGLIPHDWDVVRFREVLSTPLRNGVNKPSKVRGVGDYKMVNMNEIFAHDIIYDIPMEFVELDKNEKKTSLLEKFDLLFARQSLVLEGAGKCSLYLGNNESVCFEGHLIRARLDSKKSNPKFYYYFFSSNYGKRFIRTIKEQAVVAGIRGSDLKELQVPYPPKKEQDGIAAILSCLDRKIENLRQQNETLEQIAQTLFKHWFVDFEFPNEDGKPYKSSGGEMVRSELGEIPAGWHVEPLRKCLKHLIDNRGKTPTFLDIGIPALSAKFVKGGDLVNRNSFNYVSYELFEQSEKLEVGDIILTSEAPLGETYFIAKNTRYYPAQRVFALRANPEVISCSYLNYWFSSTIGQSLLQRRASGSTVQGIKQSELYQCEVIVPAKRIQNLASDAFMKALLKREANSQQIQSLTKIRDALLPNLMNGKVRIKS